jgi:hypothetical protein
MKHRNAARRSWAYPILKRLFLRQFLENDLISPDADRTQMLAVAGSMAISLTLFISVFRSANYVMVVYTPSQAAMAALDDRFFYLAFAMIVSALVAASQWDALAIDTRDATILEPLPVPAGTIRRAKLAAVATLGAAVAVAISVFPSLVFPWMLLFNLRELSGFTLFGLNLTHAAFSFAAAVYGYLLVVAMREITVVLLGGRWFPRVSPWIQGALIVVLGSALLLLTPIAQRVSQRGFDGWIGMTPPAWFVGVYETAVGGIIADLPAPENLPRRRVESDRHSAEWYSERRQEFPMLERRAFQAAGWTLAVTIAAYLWNARRLPALAPAPPPAFRRGWRLGRRLANAWVVRDPAARAGFYFTLAALWRSNTHRLTLACALAAGFAMAVLALSRVEVQPGGEASARLLAMQPLLYGALLVGFRHVIRVPAELRANWGFQLAWRNRERAFLSGVKRAALAALVAPALLALLPLFVYVLGPALALVHAAIGLAGAVVMLEALLVSYDKVPFTCTYVPSENMKAMGAIYGFAFVIGAALFARMQKDVLDGTDIIGPLATLALLFAILRVMSATRVRPPYVRFDEAPASFQRLGLDT